jgi:hypothetical protein
MQMLQPNMASKKTKRKNKDNEIPSQGHKGPQTSMKKWGDSQKKRCCSFTLKIFYLHPIVIEVSYATFEHVNKSGLVVNGNVKSNYKSTFLGHVSKETRSFVLENLCLGLSIYQIMNKQKSWVKEIMERTMETCQGFFYVSRTFVTWQESLQKKPTRKMKWCKKFMNVSHYQQGKGFFLPRI